MKRWFCGLLACFLITAAPLRAQTPPPEHVFTPAMSSAIDGLCGTLVQEHRTPGLAVGVVEDGRLVYARGFGYANAIRKLRAAADTEFYVGNVTMQFTAAAVLLLQQAGKLKLDDKVAKYVPELTAGANVTVAQLLLQTSGLPSLSSVPGFNDLTKPVKRADLIAALNKQPSASAPGTVYLNDPVNYMVAGLVVEKASGEPLSDYLQQQIFLPLVMERSLIAGDNGIAPTHAIGYTGGAAPPKHFNLAPVWDPSWLYGGRSLVSTVYDLAKWDIEMPILLRVDALRTMFTPAASLGPTQYGMGWVIDRRGGKRFVWSNGEISGYRAMNAVLPDDHLAVIVLANVDSLHGGRVASPEELAGRILDVVAPPSAARLDNAIVARAKEWLARLADKQVDRTQLTPAFSSYLTDELVAREDFASLGKLEEIVPISSTTETNGDTLYEFIVRYPHAVYHYKFALTADGKIDELFLED